MCNTHIKWRALLKRANALGCDYIATGHYAQIHKHNNDRYFIRKGIDETKDQSYVLWGLQQDLLIRTLLPLGTYRKTEIRQIAHDFGYPELAKKGESYEICFVPDNDYGKFLQQAKLVEKHRGEIVDLKGQVLGYHDGIEFYTIGQRKGLGISSTKPLYVVELDASTNRVVVGDDSELECDQFIVERCNWIPFDSPPEIFEAAVKIRYAHSGAPATVTSLSADRAKVKLHTPQRAITPGQAAVFYQDDLVLGGGWIAR